MSNPDPSAPRQNTADPPLAEAGVPVSQFILDSMSDGITVVDENGRFVLRNSAAEHIAGVAPQNVTLADWRSSCIVCLPDGKTPCPDDLLPTARALRGESVESAELFVRHAHAPEGKWVSVTARPFRDEQGKPKGGIAIYRDITARKQSEHALHGSETRYRTLFEKNLAGILRTMPDGRVLECNEAFAKMLGYESGAELAALKAPAFYCQQSDRNQILERLREHGSVTQQEICFRRKDGSPVWILANMNLVETDDEGGGASVISTTLDISERKRSREELRESQQRFAAFMRHLPGVAFMKNRQGQYVFCNDAAQGLFDRESEQFVGKTDREVWPAEYAERLVANDREV